MKPSKMLAVGHFSLNQVAFLVGPRKKGHVQAMFCCAAWRKMPRCGLPGGFGEDDPSKTVEIMIRSYQISDHMTYIYIYGYPIIYTISWLQSVSSHKKRVTRQVPELGPRWLAFRPWPCWVRLLPSKIWRRFRQRVM
jgi:hypothetical protein